jgi:hypothetical protein
MKKYSILLSVALCLILATTSFGGDKVIKSKGQTVYVPTVWSDHSYSDGGTFVDQKVVGHLTIRNRDPYNSIVVTSVEFYDPWGVLVLDFLITGDMTLGKFASWRWFASESGVLPWPRSLRPLPFFIVKWHAEDNVNVNDPPRQCNSPLKGIRVVL